MSPTTSVLAKLKTQKPLILTKVIQMVRGVVNAEMQNYKNVEQINDVTVVVTVMMTKTKSSSTSSQQYYSVFGCVNVHAYTSTRTTQTAPRGGVTQRDLKKTALFMSCFGSLNKSSCAAQNEFSHPIAFAKKIELARIVFT
uniref:Uncharacterized protein n=1 Tax=Glossina palpalis gambiensis TaxID=67801 RepID=A0A1B0BK47_9MUSC